jgi:hypothetical protein
MSKRCSQIVILCEDRQTDSFIRRFLKKAHSIQAHSLRVLAYPREGDGSGEQFVRNNYPNELKALRNRQHRSNTTLIVAIDADDKKTSERIVQLNTACSDAGIKPNTANDNVAFVIPKRNIETWIHYLNGKKVDETTPYPKFKDNEASCQPAVEKLHELCQQKITPPDFPDSLASACLDYQKVKRGFSA